MEHLLAALAVILDRLMQILVVMFMFLAAREQSYLPELPDIHLPVVLVHMGTSPMPMPQFIELLVAAVVVAAV